MCTPVSLKMHKMRSPNCSALCTVHYEVLCIDALCTMMYYALCTMKQYTLCNVHYAYVSVYKYAQENSKLLSRPRADANDDDDDEEVGDENGEDDYYGDVSVPKDARESTRLLSGPRQCTTLVELNVRKCCRNVSQMTHLLHLFCNRCTKHATITQKNFVCNRLCPLPLAMPGI